MKTIAVDDTAKGAKTSFLIWSIQKYYVLLAIKGIIYMYIYSIAVNYNPAQCWTSAGCIYISSSEPLWHSISATPIYYIRAMVLNVSGTL